MTNLRDELAKLYGQARQLLDNSAIKIHEPSPDALAAYQDALRTANERIKAEMIRRGDMPIVEPIDYSKAYDALVVDGNRWPPKDGGAVSDELRASTLELQRFIAYGKEGDES